MDEYRAGRGGGMVLDLAGEREWGRGESMAMDEARDKEYW